jgi:hypothetical protein
MRFRIPDLAIASDFGPGALNFPFMSDAAPNADLLRALGRVVRGLSCLFWGLPVALIVCVQAAKTEWLLSFGVLPSLTATGLLLYGLLQLGGFQRQERVWRSALDRAQLLGVLTTGMSPFLYWWNRVPAQPFFTAVVALLSVTGLIYLGQLNMVLLRLGAMLPDETLRHETRQFTALNRIILCFALVLTLAYWFVSASGFEPSLTLGLLVAYVERFGLWLLVGFVLLPLAMTMALLWKTKEVILESVFGHSY